MKYKRTIIRVYNFWFDTDIVPTVAPTLSSDGWNYWKYGITYIADLDYKYFGIMSGLITEIFRFCFCYFGDIVLI